MSLKLSAGCTCCPSGGDTCPDTCSTGTFQDEYDVTLSGLTDTSGCDVCEELNDTFTLNNPIAVTSFSDGWSGNLFGQYALAADVPTSATHACVWRCFTPSAVCHWRPYPDDGFGCFSDARFYIYGLTLAKFRISSSSFIWRMIVNYQLQLSCSCMSESDSSYTTGGWYWQFNETTNDCSLDGSETWTAYTPTVNLTVNCGYVFENLTFGDYCGGTLSMTNIENG